MWIWNQCDQLVYMFWQCWIKQKTKFAQWNVKYIHILYIISYYILLYYIIYYIILLLYIILYIIYIILYIINVYIYIYIYMKLDNWIYSYTIIYSCIVNVNLILICIELSEMWSFIVNMPENSRYLK